MFFQYIKEISSKDAECLKEAKTFLNIMEKFQADVTLLREDIENYKPARKNMGLDRYLIKLGKFLGPEYEMVERYTVSFCKKVMGVKAKKELYFNCGATNIYYKDIFLSVTELEKTLAEFYIGNFLGGQDADCPDVFKAGAIYKIAQYFYNRRDIYEKFYKFLVERQKEFCFATGKPFYEDLISLFSVKKESSVQSFRFFQEKMIEQIFEYRKDEKEDFSLGILVHVFPRISDKHTSPPNIVFELFLNKDNNLIIKAKSIGEPKEVGLSSLDKEDREFKEFVNTEIKNWLENLVLEAEFEKSIYDKIKTRLLLKNI